MIRAIIQAGFGNQLFQYATAYSLARDLGQDLELDVSFFCENRNLRAKNRRENELIHLNLTNPCFILNKNGFHKYRYITKVKFLQTLYLRNPIPLICEDVVNCREDQGSRFDIIGDAGAVLYGFWQNTNYFDRYRIELSRQFRPNYKLDSQVEGLLKEIEEENSVGVHVRRGDFVGLGWDKGRDYYDMGFDYLKKHESDCKFFIVSDDVQWVKEQYGNQTNVRIINVSTITKDIDEFFLLSSCKHQIITESTFGWWAAYLNMNKDKLVVVPKEAKGEIFNHGWYRV